MNIPEFTLAHDPRGVLAANKITSELHGLSGEKVRIIFPEWGCFFSDTLKVYQVVSGAEVLLTKQQYSAIEMLVKTSAKLGKPIHCGVLITDAAVTGEVRLDYQALGGDKHINVKKLAQIMQDVDSLLSVNWATVNHPKEFKPADHLHDARDIYGLEFVRDSLIRVKDVIGNRDTVSEQRLLQVNLAEAEGAFFTRQADGINDKLDAISLLIDDSDTKLLATHEVLIDTKNDLARLTDLTGRALTGWLDFERRAANALPSMILADLCEKQYAFNQTKFPLPLKLPGVDFWVDFTDASTITNSNAGLVVRDKAKGRIFSGLDVTIRKNPHLNKNTGVFSGFSRLTQTHGVDLKIGAGSTVIYVLARTAEKQSVVDLFSNETFYLRANLAEKTLLEYSKNIQGLTGAIARSEYGDGRNVHVACAILDNTPVSRIVSNSPNSSYKGAGGFIAEPVFSQTPNTVKYIGSNKITQDASVAEIIVVNRRLSNYEIDAISKYLQLNYGTGFTLVANGDFTSGLCDFESDCVFYPYTNTPGKALLSVKEGLKYLSTGPSALLDFEGFDAVYSAMPEYNRILQVCSDGGLGFWKQMCDLDAGVTYVLTCDLIYDNKNMPDLKLKINGVTQSTSVSLPATGCYKNNIQFVFSAPADACLLELVDSRQPGNPRYFGLNLVTLVRDFRALAN
jgi:hypothetical protein